MVKGLLPGYQPGLERSRKNSDPWTVIFTGNILLVFWQEVELMDKAGKEQEQLSFGQGLSQALPSSF